MTQVILNLSDDLAAQLKGRDEEIAGMLAETMRRRDDPAFGGFEDAIARLAGAKTPAQVLALRPCPALAARVQQLLEKNRSGGLSDQEQAEWERYELLEHFIRLAKARALLRQQPKS